MFSLVIPFAVNLFSSWVGNIFIPETPNISQELVCDRNLELGCTLDFDAGKAGSLIPKFFVDYRQISINSGKGVLVYVISVDDTISQYPFPINEVKYEWDFFDPRYYPLTNAPYSFKVQEGELKFKGQIKDYRNDELLGYFNGNEFSVVKPCAFSWNKDDNGIEIMDKYGNICFSIDLDPEVEGTWKELSEFHSWTKIKFNGYFKTDEIYHIYNGKKYFQTTDIIEAKRLISDIKPIFDHFGKNSLGTRLEKESKSG